MDYGTARDMLQDYHDEWATLFSLVNALKENGPDDAYTKGCAEMFLGYRIRNCMEYISSEYEDPLAYERVMQAYVERVRRLDELLDTVNGYRERGVLDISLLEPLRGEVRKLIYE